MHRQPTSWHAVYVEAAEGNTAMITVRHVAIVSLAIFAGAPISSARELPLQSTIDGHRVQPTQEELRALDRPDVTRSQADEIDRLYRELLGPKGKGS